MTVPSDPRKSGPYAGDGVLLSFSFDFKVFAAADIAVDFYEDATGLESRLVIDTDYTVSLNPDQDTTPGGTITLVGDFIATPPLADDALAISGKLDFSQPLDITNEGGFLPSTLENQLDRIVMQIQQVDERVGRAVLQPITDTSGSPEALVLQIQAQAAAVATIYDNFDDRYLGAKASAPTLDNDGNALIAGALYFDTTLGQLLVYNLTLTAWQAAAGNRILRETQTAVDQGGGVHTVFTLASISYVPGTNTLRVYADGVRLYSGITETNGTTVTFSPGITAGKAMLFETSEAQAGAVNSVDVGTVPTGVLTDDNLQDVLSFIGGRIGAATTTAPGTVELATDAEAVGTGGDRALVPSNFVRSLTANGYQKLPGGLIVQWGSTTASTPVVYPVAFTAVLHLHLALNNFNSAAAAAGHYQATSAESATGFTPAAAASGLGGGAKLVWIALGY